MSYLPLALIDYTQYEEIVLASWRHLMFITCVHQVYQFFQHGDFHSKSHYGSMTINGELSKSRHVR